MILRIKRLGVYGEGIADSDGYTLFVDGALPGELVRVEITEKKASFGRAKVLELLEKSPDRVTPPCPAFGLCGGCQIMHLAYTKQLENKRQLVIDALERIGKFPSPNVATCRPSPLPLGYRNKIQLPVQIGKEGLRVGLYARKSHEIVPIKRCHLHCDAGEQVLQQLLPLLQQVPLDQLGSLKTLLIKTSFHTKESLLLFVTGKEAPFLTSLAPEILQAIPSVKGVIHNFNPSQRNRILSTDFRLLAGSSYIEEQLLGKLFRFSAASFFQVNPLQAEALYQEAITRCELSGEQTVLDAYCGVGTLSLLLAPHAKEVIGVESVPEAIADARINAQNLAITNATFFCSPIEQLHLTTPLDVALLNPPRKGCDPTFLQALVHLHPKRIVYVSCDAATLARDLSLLCQHGYHFVSAQPFDMFPQTTHVETVATLKL